MKPSIPVDFEDNRTPSSAIDSKNKNEGAIWEAFKNGNESAFIYIYETYFDSLFVYGCQFTRNDDIVKDAIQDLFIEIRKNRGRLGKTDSIKFYLYKSLKRAVIKACGQWYNRCEEIDSNTAFGFVFSHEQILIERQLDEEKTAMLKQAIQSLSPRKREIIFYFYYEGLSYQQIQELMEMSHVRSARNLLYKAVDFLREQIK